MKKCELCNYGANVYCESDQASLCWDCDAKVHGANFLFAKHSRALLCHLCRSLTPWNGSGPKLGPTVSVCNNCISNSSSRDERNSEAAQGDGDDDEDEDEEEEEEEEEEDDDEDNGDGGDEEDDEENQVVPLSPTPTPPPVSSSSTSDESSTRFCSSEEGDSQSRILFSLKRVRERFSSPASLFLASTGPSRLLILPTSPTLMHICRTNQLLEMRSEHSDITKQLKHTLWKDQTGATPEEHKKQGRLNHAPQLLMEF